MNIEDFFNKRIEEIRENAKTAKGLNRCFYLVHERPDGTFNEIINDDVNLLISKFYSYVQSNCSYFHEELKYFCRHIGEPSKFDMKSPEVMTRKKAQKGTYELNPMIADFIATIRSEEGPGRSGYWD